jgi:hypothetical protein
MRKAVYGLLILAAVMVSSCGGEQSSEPLLTTTTTTTDEVVATPVGNWSYDHTSTSVKWTGFKLESRAGVSGEFDSIIVNNFTTGPNAAEAMTGVTFEIFTQSVNSKDSVRDWKLATILFGGMETEVITGEIKSIDEAEGSAVIAVILGGTSVDVPMTYEMDDDNVVKLSGSIILPTWSDAAKTGFDALAEACKEKHEGVTWEDVELNVWTKLVKGE